VSGRKARAARQAAGFVKKPKAPTPILEMSYIQAPVGYESDGRTPRYRSGKQVRRYLARRGVDTVALEEELNLLFPEVEYVGQSRTPVVPA
jgi:hypothetical protein